MRTEPEKRPLRVLHGTMEIGNQMHTLARGLTKTGVRAKTVNYYPTYLGYPADQTLDLSRYPDFEQAQKAAEAFAARAVGEFDLFHFHFGTSLTPSHADLLLLKVLGKPVLMHHWGSDVRLYSEALKRNPHVRVKTQNEAAIRNRLSFLSRFVDTCVVGDWELYDYVRDYYARVVVLPQAIDLGAYPLPEPRPPGKPLTVVHAPTNPEVKGTESILRAVEALQGRYGFVFRLVQGVPHEEARKIYAEADLVVDQVRIGSYGLLAVEAMALGKPVLCYISDFMKEKYPKNLPVISAGPDTVEETLEFLLNNRDFLLETGERSRRYVEEHHDADRICPKLRELYESLIRRKETR